MAKAGSAMTIFMSPIPFRSLFCEVCNGCILSKMFNWLVINICVRCGRCE